MLSRSVQTLRNATEVVDCFQLPTSKRSINVRKLSNRKERPHFIVVFSDSMNKPDVDQVRVVTEVSCLRSKIRYATKPSDQYPDLKNEENYLQQRINSSIMRSLGLNNF